MSNSISTNLVYNTDPVDCVPLLSIAEHIAMNVHRDDVDKGGTRYYSHLDAVCRLSAEQDGCYELGPTRVKIVALLHDLFEMHPGWTPLHLKALGFPDYLIEAIVALTRKEGEAYSEYIHRVSGNELAVVVKMADLMHNLQVSRLNGPLKEKDILRIQKYKTALDWLSSDRSTSCLDYFKKFML